ncbi:hypothetical protein ACOME3_002985 [Neoechinorhynchus agilis]
MSEGMLSHTIDGYVIRESEKMFPVRSRAALISPPETSLIQIAQSAVQPPRREVIPLETPAPLQQATDLRSSGTLPPDPRTWSVQHVADFVQRTTLNADAAAAFVREEIDGGALLLIQDEDIKRSMGIKFGPALKLIGKLDELRKEFGTDR